MIKAQPKVKTMHLGHRFLYILLLSTNLTQTQNNKTFDVHRGVDHVVQNLFVAKVEPEPIIVELPKEKTRKPLSDKMLKKFN
jgi:hypothetical protein